MMFVGPGPTLAGVPVSTFPPRPVEPWNPAPAPAAETLPQELASSMKPPFPEGEISYKNGHLTMPITRYAKEVGKTICRHLAATSKSSSV